MHKGFLLLALLLLNWPAHAALESPTLEQHYQWSPLHTPTGLSQELEIPRKTATEPRLDLPFVSLSDKQVLSDLKGTWVSLLSSNQAQNTVTLQQELNGRLVYQNSLNTTKGLFLPSIPLKPGKNELKIIWEGPGIPAQKLTLFNLGPMPGPTFALADKYNFTLYYVQDQILKKIYPIATGRPRTPTPIGQFIIGQKEVMPYANTGWGVRRMKIYTPAEYARGHWAGYAVHGTNNPASIGTEASHGCIRMFNQDVTELSQMMPLKTPVVIHKQLPFYIEKL